MPELGSLGSVRGALSNGRPYRDLVYPPNRHLALKLRAFLDIAAPRLKAWLAAEVDELSGGEMPLAWVNDLKDLGQGGHKTRP